MKAAVGFRFFKAYLLIFRPLEASTKKLLYEYSAVSLTRMGLALSGVRLSLNTEKVARPKVIL